MFFATLVQVALDSSISRVSMIANECCRRLKTSSMKTACAAVVAVLAIDVSVILIQQISQPNEEFASTVQ
jgi:hypothetical protein